jgi:hypothetical protein
VQHGAAPAASLSEEQVGSRRTDADAGMAAAALEAVEALGSSGLAGSCAVLTATDFLVCNIGRRAPGDY